MLSTEVGTWNITVIETDKNYEVYPQGYLRIVIQYMSRIHRIRSKIALTDSFCFSLSLTTLLALVFQVFLLNHFSSAHGLTNLHFLLHIL